MGLHCCNVLYNHKKKGGKEKHQALCSALHPALLHSSTESSTGVPGRNSSIAHKIKPDAAAGKQAIFHRNFAFITVLTEHWIWQQP